MAEWPWIPRSFHFFSTAIVSRGCRCVPLLQFRKQSRHRYHRWAPRDLNNWWLQGLAALIHGQIYNQDTVNSVPRCTDAEVKEQSRMGFLLPPKNPPSETRNINDIRMFFFNNLKTTYSCSVVFHLTLVIRASTFFWNIGILCLFFYGAPFFGWVVVNPSEIESMGGFGWIESVSGDVRTWMGPGFFSLEWL